MQRQPPERTKNLDLFGIRKVKEISQINQSLYQKTLFRYLNEPIQDIRYNFDNPQKSTKIKIEIDQLLDIPGGFFYHKKNSIALSSKTIAVQCGNKILTKNLEMHNKNVTEIPSPGRVHNLIFNQSGYHLCSCIGALWRLKLNNIDLESQKITSSHDFDVTYSFESCPVEWSGNNIILGCSRSIISLDLRMKTKNSLFTSTEGRINDLKCQNNNIFVGTELGELLIFDKRKTKSSGYNINENPIRTLNISRGNSIERIQYHDDKIWVGFEFIYNTRTLLSLDLENNVTRKYDIAGNIGFIGDIVYSGEKFIVVSHLSDNYNGISIVGCKTGDIICQRMLEKNKPLSVNMTPERNLIVAGFNNEKIATFKLFDLQEKEKSNLKINSKLFQEIR